MKQSELKALVSLIGDEDEEVYRHVYGKLTELGGTIIPLLEKHWEKSSMEPLAQQRIEDLIHELQFQQLKENFNHWKEDEQHDLLKGLWLIATYQYPDLELSTLTKEIEQIYYQAYVALGQEEMHPLDQVRVLNHVLFDRMGFSANTKNFHSPANSMINQVLEMKKGNPISLCCIYLLVAQKLKIPIYGVNLPNLFVLTYKNYETQFYINAFNKGIIFMRKDIDSYVENMGLEKEDTYYEPCTHLDIVSRILRNLMVSFDKLGEKDKVEEVKQLLGVLE